MKRLRVVVADDEKLARNSVKLLLEGAAEWELVGEASNGLEAIRLIEEHEPDLVLMDIEMPLRSGFETLKLLNKKPHVVFITAYNQFAIQAFDENAIDYLLKPYTDERFYAALRKAKSRISETEAQSKLDLILKVLSPELVNAKNYVTQLAVTVSDRIIIVDLKDVSWISAAGNYVELHSGTAKYLYYSTLSNLEQQLDPSEFIRINRSYLVKRSNIKSLRRHTNGEYFVIMESSVELKLSRSYKHKVKSILKG